MKVPVAKSASATKSVVTEPSQFFDLYRDGLTQGSMGRAIACPMKHVLGMIEGVSGGGIGSSYALDFGSVFHECQDRINTELMVSGIWPGLSVDQMAVNHLNFMEEEARKNITENKLQLTGEFEALEDLYGQVRILTKHYHRVWASDQTEMKWIELEKSFRVNMKSPLSGKEIPWRGKRDGAFELPSQGSELWLFETKTKGQIDVDKIGRTLNINRQAMLYLWSLWKDYGRMPTGVLYNVARRPMLRRGKSETMRAFHARVDNDVASRPEHYFVRFPATIFPEELRAFEKELMSNLAYIERIHSGELRYRNSDACTPQFGMCEYVDFCARGDKSIFTKRDLLYPELASGS